MRATLATIVLGYCILSSIQSVMADPIKDGIFDQPPPGLEPAKFAPEILTSEKHPHGHLTFTPDGKSVYWSAMLADGPEQTIFFSTIDGQVLSKPAVALFAADSGYGGATIAEDGKRLFFSARLPATDSLSRSPMAICFVDLTDTGWSQPQLIESTFDTIMTKGQVSVTRSGNLYFGGRMYSERMPAIFVCKNIDGTYSRPERLKGAITSQSLGVDPWVDPNEKFMLLSINPEEGSPMVTDIGISYRNADDTWAQPIRVADAVNTSAFERFPSMSRDGRFLFFIRSLGKKFVGDQAHYYWVDARILDSLKR